MLWIQSVVPIPSTLVNTKNALFAKNASSAGYAVNSQSAFAAKVAEHALRAIVSKYAQYAKDAKSAKYAVNARHARFLSPTFPPREMKIMGKKSFLQSNLTFEELGLDV